MREPLLLRWARRAVTVPLQLVGLALCLALLPLALPLLLLRDLVAGTRLAGVRLWLLLLGYFAAETAGLLLAALLWGATLGGLLRAASLRWHYALQRRWVGALWLLARGLYGLRLQVEGAEALADPAPVLVLARHASVADVLLPALLLSRPHGTRLRYVLKHELLWDPCLDLVGQRLRNVFVRRGSGRPEEQVARVRALARRLGPGEGVLIYPEGTRFSPARRERLLRELERAGDVEALARARAFAHVLPPRPGGPVALLEACPQADVVVLAHQGLEGSATFASLWSGRFRGTVVRVRVTRWPAGSVPRAPEAAWGWLLERWREVDAWVGAEAE